MHKCKTERIMCGTCEYWTGKREPSFNGKGEPQLTIIDEYGDCQFVNCSHIDQKRQYKNSCVCHSKWTEIL